MVKKVIQNKKRISPGEIAFQIVLEIFLSLLCILMVYPLLHVCFASLSDGKALISHRGLLLRPLNFTIAAYKRVFRDPMILKGYLNTLFIVIVGVIINILMSSIAAYILSRKHAMLRNPLMVFIIITMYFSGGTIPFYLTVNNVGLYNSLWSQILPYAINTYNLIIMRTAFAAIPDSLEESAKIDGAGHLSILFKIVLPLSKPTIAVMLLYYGVQHWNSWFPAMLFLRDRTLYPLQLILREILIDNSANQMMGGVDTNEFESVSQTIKYATIMVATVPILCVYPFLQKYFDKGVMIGALKE